MCVSSGEWLDCALEIVLNSGIERVLFADAVVILLALGHGKGHNIDIYTYIYYWSCKLWQNMYP